MATKQNGRAGKTGTPRSLSALIHRPDLVVAGVILVPCAVLYFLTTTFDRVPAMLAQNIPAEWFPRLLLGTIVLLTLILPFEHLLKPQGRELLDEERKPRVEPMLLLTASLLGLTALVITLLGVYAAMVAITVLLPRLWGERRLKIIVPYVIFFPAAVWVIFTQVLKVFFEPGILISLLF